MDSLIKETIEEFLRKMGVEYQEIEVKTSQDEAEGSRYVIKTNNSGILIGTKGAHFYALNHLLRRIIGKKMPPDTDIRFSIDVNDYGAALREGLKNKVAILAERARSLRADVSLPPMGSYERLIVHNFCQAYPDIKTESHGEGEERRVVIKYVEPVKSEQF